MRTRAATHIRLLITLSVLAVAVVGLPAVASATHGTDGEHATAELVAAPGGDAIGQVTFHQLGNDSPNVAVEVAIDEDSGLDPGIHGFHIHANDSGANDGCEPDPIDAPDGGQFGATDGHWNPDESDHGDHAGDLPVLHVNEDGTARKVFVTRAFSIDQIVDRAVIVHGDADNYANVPERYEHIDGDGSGPDETTRNTGDAGSREACGVIQAGEPDEAPPEPEAGTELSALFTDDTGTPIGGGAVVDNAGNYPGVTVAALLLEPVGDPGFHGFHLHAGNRCQFEAGSFDFGYAQGHYAPGDTDHGEHAGDLPVLYMNDESTDEQEIQGTFSADILDRFDIDEAKARTLIVHENADNYANIPEDRYQTDEGPGPDSATLAGADNGGRLACAMIEGLVRLWGNERVATAVRISQDSFLTDGTAESAVLARKDKFPDALSGVPLAEDKGGPILLTGTDELDQATADELQRVLPEGSTVHLLGGTHAISDAVADQVEELGYTVERHQGETRFETGTAIARELDATHDTIFVTTGLRWPDAVSAGGAAAQEDAVILFSAGDSPHGSTDAYLAEHEDEDVHAIGGPAARAYPDANGVVGADRDATSVKVAEEFFPGGTAYVGLARNGASGGDDDNAFADALTGGVQVGRLGGTVLLVDEEALPDPVRQYLQDNAGVVERLFAYGGVVAISDDVAGAAESAASQSTGIQVQSGSDTGASGSLLEGLLRQR